VVLIGTGSEVSLCLAAREKLAEDGIDARVVSMPSWLRFAAQSPEYQASVLPTDVFRVSVEAGATLAWPRYADLCLGIDTFGHSAPAAKVFEAFGLTPEGVADRVRAALRE
jgi:transketolase